LLPLDFSRDATPQNQAATSAAANPGSQMLLPGVPSASTPTDPALAPPATSPGAPPVAGANSRIAELSRAATERYRSMSSYIARFRRREVVNGKAKPEELMLIKFRQQPWSVFFKWLGTEGHGREVIFVEGKYDNKLNTKLAAGDVPLMAAGKRFAIAPDNSLVRSNSRHSIHEAGIGNLIQQFADLVAANARGDTHFGTLRYLGPVRRPELDQPCEAVEQMIPRGSEPGLPKGGTRLWVFDSATCLPVLATLRDETNKEVEFYCYDRIEYPAQLTDDDFNPDVIWAVPKP
jgi:hypothetical protein